jgi:hypothetical protein
MLLNPRSVASVKTEYGYASFFASQVENWGGISGRNATRHRSCPQESRVIGCVKLMAREFKPVRFFVMMAIAAFIVCGVTAFYTHRAEHGRTPEERQAYWIGEKAGEQAPRDAKLPTPAGLNMMAQKYFEQHGSGNKQNWDLAFEHGYEEGFKKTHP